MNDPLHALLSRSRLFEAMSDDDIDGLLCFVQERRLLIGDALFREGDDGRSLFVLVLGEVAVDVKGPHGDDVRVARLSPGDVLGEHSCLDPGPRSATVTATARTLCLELSDDALERMIVARPEVASRLLGVIIRETAQRLKAVDLRIVDAVEGRVPFAPPPPRAPTLRPPPSSWERLRARFGGAS